MLLELFVLLDLFFPCVFLQCLKIGGFNLGRLAKVGLENMFNMFDSASSFLLPDRVYRHVLRSAGHRDGWVVR
ncbi:hypothetical protein C8Q74DRAFT_566256 [Fomes fomentarius]|nr:hypothetical protein C8Q74DRAFT_566256 [Fomes fomentarius]